MIETGLSYVVAVIILLLVSGGVAYFMNMYNKDE
jgi:hypothetical protein